MSKPDLNLLITLDVVLDEGNVARAARRLNLSPSAMSRALERLRKTVGDPLLVRAGRGLVPTPRALELRGLVGKIVDDARAMLTPTDRFNIRNVTRTFSLRTRDGFVDNYGAELFARAQREAPGICLRFVPKVDKDSTPLREGTLDLDTGIVSDATSPELRMRALFSDRFIGVMRNGHPLSKGKVTAVHYASAQHVVAFRRGIEKNATDDALETQGLRRNITAVVGTFSEAIALARKTDLIATVPERHTENLRGRMKSFSLPLGLPDFTVSMLWHPRMDADPAHRWFRELIATVCATSG